MEKEIIGMTQKDLARYQVIKNLIAKFINGTDAAKQLSLSVCRITFRIFSHNACILIKKHRRMCFAAELV